MASRLFKKEVSLDYIQPSLQNVSGVCHGRKSTDFKQMD